MVVAASFDDKFLKDPGEGEEDRCCPDPPVIDVPDPVASISIPPRMLLCEGPPTADEGERAPPTEGRRL
jgi:hypothetical protein